jgi:hypothetical protein
MFILDPITARMLNLDAWSPPFQAGGVSGSLQQVLHTYQDNRNLTLGNQALLSAGGTGGVVGGGAGPGGGPAGAGGLVNAPPAGGFGGAAGGVPAGGQESGRIVTGNGALPEIQDNLDQVVITTGIGSGTGVGSIDMTNLSTYRQFLIPDEAKLGHDHSCKLKP